MKQRTVVELRTQSCIDTQTLPGMAYKLEQLLLSQYKLHKSI